MAITWESFGQATWKIQGSYVTVFVPTGQTQPPSPYTTGAASDPVPIGSVLQTGTVGAAYSETISASSGASPYTFAQTAGTLPTSLSLNTSTGVISGTPSVAGSYTFTITVTDSNSHTGAQGFTINIANAASGGGGNFGFVA